MSSFLKHRIELVPARVIEWVMRRVWIYLIESTEIGIGWPITVSATLFRQDGTVANQIANPKAIAEDKNPAMRFCNIPGCQITSLHNLSHLDSFGADSPNTWLYISVSVSLTKEFAALASTAFESLFEFRTRHATPRDLSLLVYSNH
jgi:hypothetical protein